MVKISTSILSFCDNDTIDKLNQTDTDYLHIDVMDGCFVKETAFSIEELKRINKRTKKPLDVHLMVFDVEKYLEVLKGLKVSFITFHYEVKKNINMIKKIKKMGIKCGISVKPNTDIKDIFSLLPYLDLVLIMSVEPGYSGQTFLSTTYEKIKIIKKEIINNKFNTLISVDGGINDKNAVKCIECGADMLVSNSFILSHNDYQAKISSLRGIKRINL